MKRSTWISGLAITAITIAAIGSARRVVADEPTKKSEEEGARHFVEIAKSFNLRGARTVTPRATRRCTATRARLTR